jgi:DNA ligase D-like protein (predicted 3'-phosphoesterase)
MPELPDVEVLKRYLDSTALYQRIEKVEVNSDRVLKEISSRQINHELEGHTFERTRRHGKSWAVPKGPSTDLGEKRLAIATEDHPIEYAQFEGLLPEEEYGAGTVLVWDTRHYRNLRAAEDNDGASMAEALEDGKVEVWLEGEKIKGGYALIRTGSGQDLRWLQVKMDDEQADARRNPTSTEPKSVLSNRTLEQIKDQEGDRQA